jgi:hypothetical protein
MVREPMKDGQEQEKAKEVKLAFIITYFNGN